MSQSETEKSAKRDQGTCCNSQLHGNYNESFKCVMWEEKAEELMPCCQLVDELSGN